jgi:hypothetical protein
MLMVYVSTVAIGINMKIIDKVKAWIKLIPSKVTDFFKRVKEFIIRHVMSLIFIVGTTGYIYFFPRMDSENSPHLFFLLVVAFLLGSMRDHEVWYKQRVKLEQELEFVKSTLSKKKK